MTDAPAVRSLSPDPFVLTPPVGWLNRIDEILRAHDITVTGELSSDLGDLVRSWRVRPPEPVDVAARVLDRKRPPSAAVPWRPLCDCTSRVHYAGEPGCSDQ